MRQRFMRFMQGRYGMDQFGRALFGATVVCLLISLFVHTNVLYLIGLALLVYSYFRMFSKNHRKRYAENQRYLQFTAGVRTKFAAWRKDALQRKTHHIYRCPGCRQKIRVPRGKGKIAITCPKCHTEFVKKS